MVFHTIDKNQLIISPSQGLNIGTVNKIFLEFPHRWWPEDKASFNFIWPEKDKKEFLQTYGQVSRYSNV